MGDGSAGEAVAVLRAAVDALLAADLSGLSGPEVTGVLCEVEVQRRRLECVDQRVLAEVGERGLAGEYAHASTASLLVELLRVSPGEAKARVGRARDMGPRRELTGQRLAPILPLVAQSQRAGVISGGHASVIAAVMGRIPWQFASASAAAERFLVDCAVHRHPGQVAKDGERLIARLDQDGAEPREPEMARRRDWTVRSNPDGSGVLTGRLTAGANAVWAAILDSLAAPLPSDEGLRDDRTPGQRRHDGFLEAGQRLLRSATLPDSGGVPATVLVRVNVTDLIQQSGCLGLGQSPVSGTDSTATDLRASDPSGTAPSWARSGGAAPNGTGSRWAGAGRGGRRAGGVSGYADTAHGDLLPIAELLHLAAEADLIPVVLDDTGAVLSYGRTRRIASPSQRLALALRDGGCCFPGCDRPSAWTQAHHVLSWLDDGRTDINNMCLLCTFHHREFERRGWAVRMSGGVPEWLPPAWLDPHRQPRRNTAHHLPDFEFG